MKPLNELNQRTSRKTAPLVDTIDMALVVLVRLLAKQAAREQLHGRNDNGASHDGPINAPDDLPNIPT